MATDPKPNVALCLKCGGVEFVSQLRSVQVDVGWKQTQIHAVAPTNMCTKCGHLSVTLNAQIGDLANLVPDTAAVERLRQQQAAVPAPLVANKKGCFVGAKKRKGPKKTTKKTTKKMTKKRAK